MDRNDFISTIGYDGLFSVVDKSLRETLKNKSLDELLDAKEFRAAAAFAIYNDSAEEKQKVADAYNSATDSKYTADSLKKLFGISDVDSTKILAL
ncbi:MAG: hypothetical protein CR988_05345 [Treponema sp.]|nr:MAG: hypothetical protein CR988_05345 [Treponema sp.]